MIQWLTRPPAVDAVLVRLQRPPVAIVTVTVVLIGSMTPAMVRAESSSVVARGLLALAVLAAGLVLWIPVLGRIPGILRLKPVVRFGYLVAQAVVPAFLSFIFIFSRHPLYAEFARSHAAIGLRPLNDQQMAGFVSKLSMLFVLLIVGAVVLARAPRSDEEFAVDDPWCGPTSSGSSSGPTGADCPARSNSSRRAVHPPTTTCPTEDAVVRSRPTAIGPSPEALPRAFDRGRASALPPDGWHGSLSRPIRARSRLRFVAWAGDPRGPGRADLPSPGQRHGAGRHRGARRSSGHGGAHGVDPASGGAVHRGRRDHADGGGLGPDPQDPGGHGAGLERCRRVRRGGLAHGWGRAARALAACSGMVPVIVVVTGPALSGPALLLGLADLVIMTTDAFAFVSGPAMVEDFTGVRIGIHQLGGTAMHARSSGLCAIEAASEEDAMAHVDHLLGLLPANADELAPPGPAGLFDVGTAGGLGSTVKSSGQSCPSGPPGPTTCGGWRRHWPTTTT